MKGHRYKDRVGQRSGRLTVVEDVGRNKKKRVLWLCRCDCGNETIVASNNLSSGRTRSCGCYRRDRIKEANRTHGHFMNGKQTRLYAIWAGMKRRCQNPNVKAFHRYGGRGITVCDEWQKFEPFLSWAMENGYQDNLSIDRINNDGDYEPRNCRWIPMSGQYRNTSTNFLITFGGVTKTLCEWAAETGLKAETISARIKRYQWPTEEALTTPVGKKPGRFKREIEEITGKPVHIC